MVAEAVGFMMSRAADGGTIAPELVTRDFLGGCQAPAPAADGPRHDAAALQVRTAPRPMLCFLSLRVFTFASFSSSSSVLNCDWTVRAPVLN